MKRNYAYDKGEGPFLSSPPHPCEWGDAEVFPEKSHYSIDITAIIYMVSISVITG
jgi:hypothetical protein